MNRRPYPSDLTDAEWSILESFVPPAKSGGRRREHHMREILNGIFYVLRSGCSWRMLPHDFPPWQTVYGYFRTWRREGIWEQMNQALREKLRTQEGRDAQPSAAILDSQSVKTTEVTGPRGYDAGKKVKGRKRHILVDTMGLLLLVLVHAANVQDRDGAKWVLEKARQCFGRLRLIWADGGYAGQLVQWVEETYHWMLQMVKRSDEVKGFVVLPRRWVVERTFGFVYGFGFNWVEILSGHPK